MNTNCLDWIESIASVLAAVISGLSFFLVLRMWRSEKRLSYLNLQHECYKATSEEISKFAKELIDLVQNEPVSLYTEVYFKARAELIFIQVKSEFPSLFHSESYQQYKDYVDLEYSLVHGVNTWEQNEEKIYLLL